MNFETKYLIRWGIPGWIFLVGMLPLMFLSNIFNTKMIGEIKGITDYITLIISLVTLGIPIGYIFQRSSFLGFWISKSEEQYKKEKEVINQFTRDVPKPSWWGIKKEARNYFYIEYQFQYNLSKLENGRLTYLSQRYAHLLSTAHSMGTLTEVTGVSCGLYFAFSFVALFVDKLFPTEDAYIFLFCCGFFHGMMAYIFKRNYRYFSSNALFYQTNLLNDIYKENQEKDSNSVQKEI